MKLIDSYLLYTGNSDIVQTVEGLQATGQTGQIILFGAEAPAALPAGCGFLSAADPFGSQSLKAIAAQAEAPTPCSTPRTPSSAWACSPWSA